MSDTNTDPNSPQMAGCQQEPCSRSFECVLTQDLKGRLRIHSAPKVFLCARVSIEDLIARHNELIRERNELREAMREIVACGLNCKDSLDEAEQMERIAKEALSSENVKGMARRGRA